MKAIQFDNPRSIKLVDIPEPRQPGPGEVTVGTHCMGICGTDYSSYLGKFPFFDYPRIPGHELGVEVLAIGPDVEDIQVGDRCSVEPYMNCGTCYACRTQATNCCANLKVIGVMVDGGLCEKFNIRADKLHVSKSLSFDQLALVETLAIGCHAIDRGSPSPNDRVLIIGAGPIGLSALEFALIDETQVTIMDISDDKLKFCSDNYRIKNAIKAVEPETDLKNLIDVTHGELFSVVIDATGNAQSMANSINYLAPTGKLVYVGISTQEIVFAHPKFHRPEATLLASRNALPADFTKIISLIEDGKIETDRWITHRSTIDQISSDFDNYLSPDSAVVKAVIDVT